MVDVVGPTNTQSPVVLEADTSEWHVVLSGQGQPVPNLYLARTARRPSLRGLTPEVLDEAIANRRKVLIPTPERLIAVSLPHESFDTESPLVVEQVSEQSRTVEVPAAVKVVPTAPSVPWTVKVAKRVLDIAASFFALLLAWPVMAMVAIAIKLESKGPAVFSQERIGTGGKPFTMYKFRSMRSDAETASGPVWAKANDDRITPLGRFLRKARLDELPQLWNVLRGDMSLVGPRPERRFFIEKLERVVPAYNDRLSHCKPGITGWAQINLPYDTSIESVKTKVLYDLAYGAHMYSLGSYLWMESKIILRTFGVLILGKGAH